MNQETLVEEGQKYQAAKEAKNQRSIRCNEIKTQIARLEGERKAIKHSSPEADVLAAQWKADVEYFASEFVSELAGRVREGRSTKIRFDSPAAMAYFNADRWLDAIPALAERVAGATNTGGRTIAAINSEIMVLRCELNSLGGF